MTNEQKQVRDWMKAFGQECPEKPVIPEEQIRLLRAKLIYEEAIETINALGCLEIDGKIVLGKKENLLSLAEICDGCEDLKVVTEGTLIACGLIKPETNDYLTDNDPLFDEVMRSNNSKVWNDEVDAFNPELSYTKIADHPEIDISYYVARDKDGKVIKSPSYSPPNLAPIIEEMSK